MALKRLPVGPAEIAVLLSLTRSWTLDGVEDVLVRAGWATEGEPVTWSGGAGSPHFFGDEENGWRLELGDEPGTPTASVRLPCALYWPALDIDEEYEEVVEPSPADEDDIDDEYATVWEREPDADRDVFDQEFERVSDLLRAELGPGKRMEGVLPRETWQHNGFEVTLEMIDDLHSHSHYDVVAVVLRVP